MIDGGRGGAQGRGGGALAFGPRLGSPGGDELVSKTRGRDGWQLRRSGCRIERCAVWNLAKRETNCLPPPPKVFTIQYVADFGEVGGSDMVKEAHST